MKIGYMRVSSDTDRQSTDLQRDALIQAGVDPRHLFEDKMSGAYDKRPGLEKALQFLQEGDCLVVWKLDRLGRSLSHLLRIITELQNRNITFCSLTEQMDTTTAQGQMQFGLFGVLAQYERALIKERVQAGLAAARKRGKKGGRPCAITPETKEAIKESLRLDKSKAFICRTLNIKRSTLYALLEREGEGFVADVGCEGENAS